LDYLTSVATHNRTTYSFLVFLGDMAGDLDAENSARGDFFIRNISRFTPWLPMVVTPGDHERGNNSEFTYFRKSFYSLDDDDYNSTFYNFQSFDIGLAHFIGLNFFYFIYNHSND
jgi:hypothetical protein